MGEGWSDYIACTINDTIVVGDWVVNNPNGIRGFHYDSNYPDNFGDLGSGRYDGSAPHPIGEIWCATLLEMNRNIGSALGAQLVVDGLKLTRANPGFLDARDGILAALDALLNGDRIAAADYNIALDGIWQAFAHFGMGPQARSNGPFLNGIVADFNPPVSASPEPEPTPLPVPGGADVLLETSPNLAIPDNRATGVSSILNVTQAGKIADLSVFVDIKHTFIGDLRVRLISPAGTVAVLHDRNGGGGDDLAATYHSADVPALGALLNEDAQGSWTLQIADLAAADFGTLRRWSLIMKLAAAAQPVRGEAVPGLSIPDNHPAGISSSIAITSSGTVHQIRVSVDITHTYIGDLRVTLIAPGGERALLHDRFGGSADNLIRSYDSLTSAVLHTFIGWPVGGNWTLQVADLAGVDIGKLNRWQLEIDV
jgi:extracellular elastinolytic metalloproteinase